MEYRKLIKFGKNSFVISLPKNWLNQNKLKKGDLLYVNESDEGLSISSKNNEKKEFKKITIDTGNKSLKRIHSEIISSYLNNYDEIHLDGDNIKENAVQIKEFLNKLAGLEVIEQTKTKIVVKDLLDKGSISVTKLIRRVDMIIRGMLDDSILSINEDNYESIYQRDHDINRLVFLLQRILRSCLDVPCVNKTEEKMDNFKIIMFFEISVHLERIGDQTKRIARYVIKLKSNDKTKKDLEILYEKIKKLYLDAMKAFYTDDKELTYEVIEEGSKLVDECNVFLKKYPGMNKGMITDYMKRMISCIRCIATAVMNYDKPINQKS